MSDISLTFTHTVFFCQGGDFPLISIVFKLSYKKFFEILKYYAFRILLFM